MAVARGNEKGRVERTIRYIRSSFFAARKWRDLADLNEQALAWCQGPAAQRKWPDDPTLTVQEAFERERTQLLPLPATPFPADERVEVRVGKTPYVRFDLNDYSVPHTHVRRTLTVLANPNTVRILDGCLILATHARSFDRGTQVEDPAHLQALVAHKREAKLHRGRDRLYHAAPGSDALFALAATEGKSLGALTSGLLQLLDLYGADALKLAIAEVAAAGRCHVAAVRQALERARYEKGLAPPVPIPLPNDPRLRNLAIRPHSLLAYDQLAQSGQEAQS